MSQLIKNVTAVPEETGDQINFIIVKIYVETRLYTKFWYKNI